MQHKESTLGKLQEIREFLDSAYMVGMPVKYRWSCAANGRLTWVAEIMMDKCYASGLCADYWTTYICV